MKIFNINGANSFVKAQGGVALIEFALALPLLLLLILGAVELSTFAQAHQRVDKTNHQFANSITRIPNVTVTNIDAILAAAPNLLEPFEASRASFVVSLVNRGSNPGDQAIITDQLIRGGGTPSQIGALGDVAAIPSFTLEPGGQVVVVETYYDYDELLAPLHALVNFSLGSANGLIYQRAVYRPRSTTIAATFPL